VGYIILRRFNEGEELQRGTPVGDKLYKLTGGRSGYLQSDQTSSESSSDRRRLDSGNAANGANGGAGHAHGGVSSHKGVGGPVNGVNGTQGAVEWERKWADGGQPKPVVLETENVFEVLKAVSKHPVSRQCITNHINRRLQSPRSVPGTRARDAGLKESLSLWHLLT